MATYSRNVTCKQTTNARGTVTTPTNSNVDIFTVPAGYRYKITCFMLARNQASSPTSEFLRLKAGSGNYYDLGNFELGQKANNGQMSVNATLRNGSTNATLFVFDPPLELAEGQGLNMRSSFVGGGSADWEIFGETLLNTP